MKHSTMPRPKKPMKAHPYRSVQTRQGLERLADKVMSAFVIARDKFCVLCGSYYLLGAGHFYKRRHESVRWSACNVHALCQTCNQQDNEDHAPYQRFMTRTYTADELIALGELKEHGVTLTDEELGDLIITTKGATKTLQETSYAD